MGLKIRMALILVEKISFKRVLDNKILMCLNAEKEKHTEYIKNHKVNFSNQLLREIKDI